MPRNKHAAAPGSASSNGTSKARAEKIDTFFGDVRQIFLTHSLGHELVTANLVPASNNPVDISEYVENQPADSERSSIDQKLIDKKYTRDVYQLYHDLKLATVVNLVKLPVGSAKYTAFNDFFKFASGLLLREAARLGFLQEPRADDDDDSLADSGFEAEVFNGFKKISVDLEEWFGEAYYIMSQTGPLFSSLNGKSSIDPRSTELRGQFHTTKVLPQLTSNNVSQLGYVSPVVSRVPHPALSPTEIMANYVHPTEAALPSSRWLKYDAFSSFAPSRDDGATVIQGDAAASVWFENIGMDRIASAAAAAADDAASEDDEEDEEEEAETTVETKKEDESKDVSAEPEREEDEENGAEPKAEDETPGPESAAEDVEMPDVKPEDPAVTAALNLFEDEGIDIRSVLEWSPASVVDDDEIEAAKAHTEPQLLSYLLLELQNLQRKRLGLTGGQELVVTDPERRLAYKIQNLLARQVADVSPSSLGLAPSRLLPVLQVNYAGVLPAPDPKPMPQAGRLASLNARGTPARRGRPPSVRPQ